jgi:hypothetical protein
VEHSGDQGVAPSVKQEVEGDSANILSEFRRDSTSSTESSVGMTIGLEAQERDPPRFSARQEDAVAGVNRERVEPTGLDDSRTLTSKALVCTAVFQKTSNDRHAREAVERRRCAPKQKDAAAMVEGDLAPWRGWCD